MSDTTKKAARGSNLELLRILAILAVIADHFIGQSGNAAYNTVPLALFYGIASGFSRLACAVFVVIGAWFLTNKPFRTRRLLSLWISLLMYTFTVTILCRLGGLDVSLGAIRWSLFPISTQQLWFISKYIVLLALSPFLNLILEKLPREALRLALVVFCVLLTGYSTLFAEDGIFADTLYAFVFLYMLTGYLRKYQDSRAAQFFAKPAVFFAGIGVMLLLAAGRGLAEYRGIDGKVMQYLLYYRQALCAAPIALTAPAVVSFFYNRKTGSSKIINTLSSATLGVYILHQVPAFYRFLWNGVFRSAEHAGQPMYALFVVAATYFGCTAVELLRAKLLMPLIEHSGLFARVCNKVDGIVNAETGNDNI